MKLLVTGSEGYIGCLLTPYLRARGHDVTGLDTGYYRDGCCNTDEHDQGSHVVCAKVTQALLDFSLMRGNDLITPRPEHRFAGLKAGDRWCLCARRWQEALNAGVAPPVVLECTHAKALEFVTLEQLQSCA
jgi:uncharacterized protein (DUF2237 family)